MDILVMRELQQEEQKQFQQLVPIVENILDENIDLLTDQEEAWLYRYLLYLNGSGTLPEVIREQSEKIINRFEEL